jgi:hypothetical protein
VLGASNVAMGLRPAIAAVRETLGPRLDLFVACGHGRSYGVRGNFLGRSLPSIADCGLWSALDACGPAPTYALVTDLGNDLGFGSSAAQLEQWLLRSLEKLEACGARIVVTGLPVARIAALPRWEFALFASLFFPTRGVVRERVLAEARDLEGRLGALANSGRIVKVDPEPAWYGRDPIHVTKPSRPAAWKAFTAGWRQSGGLASGAVEPQGPAKVAGRLWYERVRLFGVEAGCRQPCASTEDGTQVSMF